MAGLYIVSNVLNISILFTDNFIASVKITNYAYGYG